MRIGKEMPSLDTFDFNNRKRLFMFIGEKFSGKSVAAASWVYRDPTKPILILDFDSRIESVARHYKSTDIISRIEYETYAPKNFQECLERITALKSGCKYSAVIVDSITTLSLTWVNWQMFLKGSLGKVGPKGAAVPGWDEVNGETTGICQIVDILRKVDADIIFTAHPIRRVETTGSGQNMSVVKYKSLVSFGMKLQDILPAYFGEMWFFNSEPAAPPKSRDLIEYYITTKPDGTDIGNTLFDLPGRINWTGEKLWPYLFGESGLVKEKFK